MPFEFQPLAEVEAEATDASGQRFSLAAVEGAETPDGRLRAWLGPKIVGGRYFRLFLEPGVGRQVRFLEGLYNNGPYPGQNWVEVYDIDLPSGLRELPDWEPRLAPYLEPVARAVPPGGHMMIEYEKPMWRSTQLGLLAGIPPLATPLGGLLYAAGSGDSFKDWYFPEGGQEGGRKLQGNKAYTPEQAREMAEQRVAELRAYLASPPRGDAAIEARARRGAEQILGKLGA
jgi:hypothetical protein